MKKVASIIPVHNRKETTLGVLGQLKELDLSACKGRFEKDLWDEGYSVATIYEHQIVVVDDGSVDGTGEAIEELFPEVVLLTGDANLWWTGAVNRGVEYCLSHGYSFIHIMNDDIKFKRNFLKNLLLSWKPNRILGSITLLGGDSGKIYKAGMMENRRLHPRYLDIFGGVAYSQIDKRKLIPAEGVSGRSMLVDAELFKKVGLFDEKRFPHGGADQEFCSRALKKGWEIYVNPASVIYTKPSTEKTLAQRLVGDTRLGFFKSFGCLKYNWYLPLIFWSHFAHRSFFAGLGGFSYNILAMFKWTVLKFSLGKNTLRRYVEMNLPSRL